MTILQHCSPTISSQVPELTSWVASITSCKLHLKTECRGMQCKHTRCYNATFPQPHRFTNRNHAWFTIDVVKVGITTLVLGGREMLTTVPFILKETSMMILPTISVARRSFAEMPGLSWNKASRPYIATDMLGLLPVALRLSRVEERFTIAGGSSGCSPIGRFAKEMFIIWLNSPDMLGVKVLSAPRTEGGSSTWTPNSGAANWNGSPGATSTTFSTNSTTSNILSKEEEFGADDQYNQHCSFIR